MLTMMNQEEVEEEVWAECSDDEMYNPGKMPKGTWEPKAEDMMKLFEELKSKKVLELSWKCPGRRPPESDIKEEEIKEELIDTPPKQEEKKQIVPNEFDFDDFPDTKTVLTPRRTPGSAPKQQKKVAKMDKVLKDMMQQRKLQAAEREARKLAKSPRGNPSSPGRARLGSPAGSPRTPSTSHGNRNSPVRLSGGVDNNMTTPLRAPLDHNSPLRNPAEQENTRKPLTSELGNASANSLSHSGETNIVSNSGRLTPSRQSATPGGFVNKPLPLESNLSQRSREIGSVNNSVMGTEKQTTQHKDNASTSASNTGNTTEQSKSTTDTNMDTS